MKTLPLAAFALIILPLSFNASAGEQVLFYVAGGASTRGANVSFGAGTDADVLELSSIRLGAPTGDSTAKFVGLSLVQNAVPVNKFNLMFRLGVGKETTSFANGAYATRMGFRHGIIVGVGGQYELNDHFALRGEVNRIEFATAADDVSTRIAYPITLSALYIF